MSGQGQGGFGGGQMGGGYGGPQQQGGWMQQQWQPPQGASPMQPGAGGAPQQNWGAYPQYQAPPSFAQLFGGAMNNGGQSVGYYSGRGSNYGAPYGTFPGGMGGSGGNMWPGPVNKGAYQGPGAMNPSIFADAGGSQYLGAQSPVADPAPGAGAMGGAMTPVVNKDPAFSAQNAALNFGNGVNNGYFSWGGR